MAKIKKITVSNLKAVDFISADFNGATAIITGANNRGKTTFLRGLFDRMQGIKPAVILRHDQHEGFAEYELTTGEKMRWSFEDRTKTGEKLVFVTDKEIKTPLSREIAQRFFPETFDIDKFMMDSPAKQRAELQKFIGIDFTDVDTRYKEAFDDRTNKNRTAKEQQIKFEGMAIPEKVAEVKLDELLAEKEIIRKKLNDLYEANKNKNKATKDAWLKKRDKVQADITIFNNKQKELRDVIVNAESILDEFIQKIEDYDVAEFVDVSKLREHIASMEQPQDPKDATKLLPKEPQYIVELPDNAELLAIDEKINNANETNRKAGLYSNYLDQRTKAVEAQAAATEADDKVKAIEKERVEMIQKADMPEGFGFTDEGITYNGYEFTKEQLSSSGLYIAALKLAAKKLGEVKTLFFDASYLDKNSLMEIETWAKTEDLQLLIERPDFEAGDITYELVNIEQE